MDLKTVKLNCLTLGELENLFILLVNQEIDSAIAEYSTFYLQKCLGCLCSMFWVIIHFYYEALPLYTSASGCLCPSSINTSNTVPLVAMHAHSINFFISLKKRIFFLIIIHK